MQARLISGTGAFGLLLLAYGAFLGVTQADWLLAGAVWAEGATNYWPAAHSPDLAERLLATDSGYIPLPQRLLALPGALMPAAWWPSWLSLASTLGAVALVAGFCAAPFRALVADDRQRLLVAAVLLLAMDFQTAQFINFIYLALLPLAGLAALAMAGRPVPKWAWIAPGLCLSKPAVLAVVPAMVLAAWRADSRWRKIAAVCVAVALLQLARMATSHAAGTMAGHLPFTLAQKAGGAVTLAFSFLATFVVPPAAVLSAMGKLATGLVIAVALGWHARRTATPARSLIVCGAILLAGNFVLLAFTLPDDWLGAPRLAGFTLMRQNMPALIGAALIVLGAVQALPGRAQVLAVALWGLSLLALALGDPARRAPADAAPQWLPLAAAIDAGVTPLCVPVAPAGWVFERGCRSLGGGFQRGLVVAYRGAATRQIITDRPALGGNHIVAVAVMASPRDGTATPATAFALLRDGRRVPLRPVGPLPANGGLVLFHAAAPLLATDVHQVVVDFAAPVIPGRYALFDPADPVSGWFGY